MRSPLIALALVAALAGCSKEPEQALAPSAPVAAVPPPAGRQWTEVVTATADGGFVMGNPNAEVKLIEYAAFTCPHCKEFTEQGLPTLTRDYVATGKISYELRPFLLNGADLAVTLLAQCRGAQTFFPIAEQVFAAQSDWLGKLIATPEATQQGWQSLAPTDRIKAQADAAGLRPFFAARGLSSAQADACLADEAAADRILAVRDKATNELQVTGTPSFFINGQLQENVAGWKELQPRLKAAVG